MNTYHTAILTVLALFGVLVPQTHSATLISGQLNENLSANSFHRDSLYQITADDLAVVYSARDAGDNDAFSIQLYIANLDGSNPRQLTDIAREGHVFHFRLTSDSRFAVFRTTVGVFSVNLESGLPVRLDSSINASANSFEISPDGQFVVIEYLAGIYSVPVVGGQVSLLSDTNYPQQGDVLGFRITPNSSKVVFSRQEFSDTGVPSLHILSTPIEGGDLIELLPTDEGPQDVFSHAVSPDSKYLVYSSASGSGVQIKSVLLTGGDAVALSAEFDYDFFLTFGFTPDGQNVIYGVLPNDQDEVDHSYLVPTDGGASTHLNFDVSAGKRDCGTRFTPDSVNAVICRKETDSNEGRFFAAPISNLAVKTPLNSGDTLDLQNANIWFSENDDEMLINTVIPNESIFDHRLLTLPLDGSLPKIVFEYQSNGSSSPCFNGLEFSQHRSIFSDCRREVSDSIARIVTQEIGRARVNELIKPKIPSSESPAYHDITDDGEQVVFVTQQANEGSPPTNKLYSTEAKPSDDGICFPVKTKETVTTVCF